MKEVLTYLISVNKKRPDYLVIILREITAISEDHRLRPRLWRSLRALQETQPLSNPLVCIYCTRDQTLQTISVHYIHVNVMFYRT